MLFVLRAVCLVGLAALATGDLATCDGESSSLLQFGHGAPGAPTGAKCFDGREIVADPAAVHVVWIPDLVQAEGLKGSIASAISATSSPLVAHVLVQRGKAKSFGHFFGIAAGCRSARLGARGVLQLHAFDADVVADSRPDPDIVNGTTEWRLDNVENFARLHMHTLIPNMKVVIYLDADTVVQADLTVLRDQFAASGKTIGFAHWGDWNMRRQMSESPACNFTTPERWEELRKLPAYNNGVLVLDLERWARLHVVEHIEDLVRKKNACHEKLWGRGSQPLLLMALYTAKDGLAQEIAVFENSWNSCDLGENESISDSTLKSGKILHWSGLANRKPWLPDGLYPQMWKPHRERYDELIAWRPVQGRLWQALAHDGDGTSPFSYPAAPEPVV